jgi:hypothetical protein
MLMPIDVEWATLSSGTDEGYETSVGPAFFRLRGFCILGGGV